MDPERAQAKAEEFLSEIFAGEDERKPRLREKLARMLQEASIESAPVRKAKPRAKAKAKTKAKARPKKRK